MNKKDLVIKIKGADIFVLLKNEHGKVVDEYSWNDQNNLSTTLLDAIDKILLRNKISIEQLNNCDVESDQKTYTSTRIAETVAKTVRYCLTFF